MYSFSRFCVLMVKDSLPQFLPIPATPQGFEGVSLGSVVIKNTHMGL